MDTLHERVTQTLERQQRVQIIGADRDIGHFARDGRTVTDGNTGICLGKRRGIVHAVAKHDDLASGCVFCPNEGSLVLRKNFGIIGIHADRLCDCTGGLLIVTGHHDQPGHTERTQAADNVGRFLPQRVFHADDCRKHAGNGKIQVGICIRQSVKFGLLPCRNDAMLVVKNKVMAADDDLLPVNAAGDAVRDKVFHV